MSDLEILGSTYVVSLDVCFFSLMGIMIFFGIVNYRSYGWKGLRRFLIGYFLIPLPVDCVFTDNIHEPVLSAFGFAHCLTFVVYIIFVTYNWFRYNAYKAEIDAFYDAQINAMPPPSDYELLKIKATMGFDKSGPAFFTIQSDLQRAELTRRWKIKKRKELFDLFAWKKFAKKK